jgi:ribosomal protein S18 acetylase RimI-like enzyme
MNSLGHVRQPVLRCGRCGKFVDWEESRLQVVCTCRPHLDLYPVLVREGVDGDRERTQSLFRRHFGHAPVVAFGAVVPLDQAPTLVAEIENEVGGALAWRTFNGAFHIIAVASDPMWQRAGLGSHLVAEAELLARRKEQPRVIATITNDNIPALYFYQRRGYRVSAILSDSVAPHARNDAPGFAGIPIVDEIHLTKTLSS